MTPPGRLVDVGGFRLHVNCTGSGRPAVVLDSALGGSSVSWSLVQPEVARFAHVCSYDRAGFGWSDAGPMPRTAGRIAGELRILLDRGGVEPPYLLVGHSYGGLVMRIFACRYRADTAGLLLVDPAHPEDWIRPAPKEQVKIDRGVLLCRYGARAARFRVAHLVGMLAGLGAYGPAEALVRLVSLGRLSKEDQGILAPVWRLPPDARRPLRWFWSQPRFFEALGSQIAAMPISASEAFEASAGGYGDLPLMTISSTDPGEYRLAQQEALARLSTRGRHIVASASGHWIPLDQPQVVVDAVRELISKARGAN
jgi:pimeloyl-ACP methyl ester carboxylesterase